MEVHFKLFGTDGVALQSQELTKALIERDWQVHPCCSDVPSGTEGLKIPQLSYQAPDAVALRMRIFPPAADVPTRRPSRQAMVLWRRSQRVPNRFGERSSGTWTPTRSSFCTSAT